MYDWRTQAKKGVDAFELLGDGPLAYTPPQSGTRGAAIPVKRLIGLPSTGQPALQKSEPLLMHVAHGSWAIGLAWLLWSTFGLCMILQERGGGNWMLWFALGIPGWLCQSRNQVVVSSCDLFIRRGLSGDADRRLMMADITDVWVSQGTWGRLFEFGRIGVRLTDGDVVWSPLLNNPVAAKHAIVMAVTGRKPPVLPPHQQSILHNI